MQVLGFRSKRALTLLETLVVCVIVAVLLAIAIPAVMSARHRMYRVECGNKLRQIGFALSAYESTHECFPPGSIHSKNGAGSGMSQLILLLPDLGESALWNRVNHQLPAAHVSNTTLAQISVGAFLCPADFRDSTLGITNYAGSMGSGSWERPMDGIFASSIRGVIRIADVSDGLSQTACFSEWVHGKASGDSGERQWTPGTGVEGWIFAMKPPPTRDGFIRLCGAMDDSTPPHDALGIHWPRGAPGFAWYNHQIVPGSPSCYLIGDKPPAGGKNSAFSAGSRHPGGGVNLLCCDSSVRFVSSTISIKTWQDLGSRNGGEYVPDEF